jgi:hypothetical protein
MQTKLMRNAYATHTDYSEFKGLIAENPNFVPSNVDGIAERKGKFLVMEWKRDGEKVSKGQQILLQSLASLHNFMVVIIYGDTDNETRIGKFYIVQPTGSCILAGNGINMFKEYYRTWYDWADGK